MKHRLVLLILSLLAQAAFGFIVDFTTVDARVAVMITVLTTYLGIDALLRSHEESRLHARLDQLSEAHVETLDDKAFYALFPAVVAKRQKFAYVTYLAPEPPDAKGGYAREAYDARLDAAIRKSAVPFRRIVRKTKANIPWIRSLVTAYAGLAHVSIAVVADSRDAEMPLGLSVQIVDDLHVYLVALEGHYETGTGRDRYFRSVGLARTLHTYYDRLWKRADPVLENGVLTDAGQKLLADGMTD
jgi:hypothetical protein